MSEEDGRAALALCRACLLTVDELPYTEELKTTVWEMKNKTG